MSSWFLDLWNGLVLWLPQLANAFLVGAFGLLGVIVGAYLTARNQKLERRHSFLRAQISEFYGPMLAYHQHVKTKGNLRMRVHVEVDKGWRQLCENVRGDSESMREMREKSSPQLEKVIEYDNSQLEAVLLPIYRDMLRLFETKMHLAGDSTRAHFETLVEFVELWERSLGGSIPSFAVDNLAADEKALRGFYEDLETKFAALQTELKS